MKNGGKALYANVTQNELGQGARDLYSDLKYGRHCLKVRCLEESRHSMWELKESID